MDKIGLVLFTVVICFAGFTFIFSTLLPSNEQNLVAKLIKENEEIVERQSKLIELVVQQQQMISELKESVEKLPQYQEPIEKALEGFGLVPTSLSALSNELQQIKKKLGANYSLYNFDVPLAPQNATDISYLQQLWMRLTRVAVAAKEIPIYNNFVKPGHGRTISLVGLRQGIVEAQKRIILREDKVQRCLEWDYRYTNKFFSCTEKWTIEFSSKNCNGVMHSIANRTICGDVHNVSNLISNYFDLVVSTQVLEHVAYPYVAAENMVNVLRPGGYLVVSAPMTSMAHPYPTDFWRFTMAGVIQLFQGKNICLREKMVVGDRLLVFTQAAAFGANEWSKYEQEKILKIGMTPKRGDLFSETFLLFQKPFEAGVC